MYEIASVDYTNNSSFNPKNHLNSSKLYFTENSSYKLNSVFLTIFLL